MCTLHKYMYSIHIIMSYMSCIAVFFLLVDRIAEEKKELDKEAQEIAVNLREHQRLVEEEKKASFLTNKQYQSDLIQQIEFKDMVQSKERENSIKEILMAEEAERLHQQRVEHAIMNPDINKIHPQRLILARNKKL